MTLPPVARLDGEVATEMEAAQAAQAAQGASPTCSCLSGLAMLPLASWCQFGARPQLLVDEQASSQLGGCW